MKKLLSLLVSIALLCLPAPATAQVVTWGTVAAAPSFVSTQGSIGTHFGFFSTFTTTNGTTGNTWQLSPTGPQISNSSGAIEARNAALSAFAIVRGATPVASNDLATKAYVDGVGAAITIPSLTGIATSTGCLSFGGGVYAWASCGGGGTSVTGTGFWYNATGTLNGAAVGLSGDATLGALSGGNVPLTLATVNGNIGTFGNSTTIPVITVNAKGLITGVTTAAVSGGGGTSVTGTGLWYSASGSLNAAAVSLSGDGTLGALSGSNLPLTLATVNGNVGTFGTASSIPAITVNAKGLITGVTTNTVAAALGSATGTLTPAHGGTGLTSLTANGVVIGEGTSNVDSVVLGNAQLLVGQTSADPQAETMSGDATLSNAGALTLATVNATTGSFGSASAIPIFSVNGKGLITAASTATVAAPLASATGTLAVTQLGHGTSGQLLMTNGTTPTWTSYSGDVTVTSTGTTTVTAISGGTPIPIAPTNLLWQSSTANPLLSQATPTSNVATNNLTIAPQKPFASASGTTNGTPGSLIANLGAPVSTGNEATFEVARNGTGLAWLGPVNGASTYGALFVGSNNGTNYAMASNGSTLILNSVGGTNEVQMYSGSLHQEDLYDDGTSGGIQLLYPGNMDFGGGRNVISISPVLTDFTGATTSGVGLSVPAHNVLELNGNVLEFSSFQSNPSFTQAQAAASTNGGILSLNGQQGGAGNSNGGTVAITGGQSTGSGQPGQVAIADGSDTYELFVSPTGTFLQGNNLEWLSGNTGPTLTQQRPSTDVSTNNFFIQAQQAASGATVNTHGGSLFIAAGAGTTADKGGTTFMLAGDQQTGVAIIPGTNASGGILGTSTFGSSSTEDRLVAQGSGTVNSQQVLKERFRLFCRTTSNAQVNCGSPFTIGSGVTATFRLIVTARDVTAPSSTSDLAAEKLGMVHNVGGTVSQVGTTVFASTSMTVTGTNSNLVGATFTTSLSGATVQFKAGGIAGTDTYDWEVDGEIILN